MTLMRNGRDRRSENPFRATRGKNACVWDRSADHIRASGHNGCIQRPDTWLHPNASRKRQILFPCTAGAVHTRHIATFCGAHKAFEFASAFEELWIRILLSAAQSARRKRRLSKHPGNFRRTPTDDDRTSQAQGRKFPPSVFMRRAATGLIVNELDPMPVGCGLACAIPRTAAPARRRTARTAPRDRSMRSCR
jgi:hypothetical protein